VVGLALDSRPSRIWRNALLATAFLGVPILPVEARQLAAQPLAGAPSYEQVLNRLSHIFPASGVALLHAALLEPRIQQITIESALSAYAFFFDAGVHRNVADSVFPGVLLHYDLDDLMIAIAPRSISIVHPVNGAGDKLTELPFTISPLAFSKAIRHCVGTDGLFIAAAPPIEPPIVLPGEIADVAQAFGQEEDITVLTLQSARA
jgi:hypothetical protein